MKPFLLTWFAAFVIITALLYALQAFMIGWPLWGKTLVLSGIMVWTMQKFITPIIKRF